MLPAGKTYLLAHFSAAEQILAHYDGSEPFPLYLKSFFRNNRKFGSRDRKQIASFCFAFFRLGAALPELPIRERICIGLFLCLSDPDPVMVQLRPEWMGFSENTPEQKENFIQMSYPDFRLQDIFPYLDKISSGIDSRAFSLSHLMQPDLFIRVRPGRKQMITDRLAEKKITARACSDTAIAIPAATPLEELGSPDVDYVIQDLSSQRVADFFPELSDVGSPLILDACAGSGGKSILAFDRYRPCRIDVIDQREGILRNLDRRFAVAGIRKYRSLCLDITETNNRKSGLNEFLQPGGYDLVIADVPCSGSGTWSRNPWEMLYFPASEIAAYSGLQRKILRTLTPAVKPGGYLLYVTCSVYAEENEQNVSFLLGNSLLQLQHARILKGYAEKADSMFAALFTLPV